MTADVVDERLRVVRDRQPRWSANDADMAVNEVLALVGDHQDHDLWWRKDGAVKVNVAKIVPGVNKRPQVGVSVPFGL